MRTAARACPVVDAEENVVFVLVADGGQVGDGAWQVAALLAAQHAAELDLAAQRHLVHYARATQLDPTDGNSRVASRTAVSKKNNEDKAGIKKTERRKVSAPHGRKSTGFGSLFRPPRMHCAHAASCYRRNGVVCMRVGHDRDFSPAKTEKPTEMPFLGADLCGPKTTMHYTDAHWRHLANTMGRSVLPASSDNHALKRTKFGYHGKVH